MRSNVPAANALTRGPHKHLLNYDHVCLKLESKGRRNGRLVKIYGVPRTPLPRVLESAQVTLETKGWCVVEKERLNPFALKRDMEPGLKQIARMR